MTTGRPLPVLLPRVPGQRWACHSCTECCRTPIADITDEERRRIDHQGWAGRLGRQPYLRLQGRWVLNKRDDGTCVFLRDDNLCMIHAEFGEAAKPLTCCRFPFALRATPAGWRVALRFDCPSVAAAHGEPIDRLTAEVRKVLPDRHHVRSERPPRLQRRLDATTEEIDRITTRFVQWLHDPQRPLRDALIGAARLTATLSEVKFAKVRGQRLGELLDLLFNALPAELHEPEPPGSRHRGLLRQLAFAHAEHVSLADLRAPIWRRIARRWRQFRSARHFREGIGAVPPPPGFDTRVPFNAVEAVTPREPTDEPATETPALEQPSTIDDLLRRYLIQRLESRSVFGEGYYNWPVIEGLAALWLSVAVIGWLARYCAAADERTAIRFDDATRAVGIVDRAATRLPALGTLTERIRVRYLLADDAVARLIMAYRLTETGG